MSFENNYWSWMLKIQYRRKVDAVWMELEDQSHFLAAD
jgi:hypothetical protein